MEEQSEPIETAVGIIKGRAALSLETFAYDGHTLFLEGALDGGRASRSDERDWYFSIAFQGVLALQVLELDSWLASGKGIDCQSNFEETKNSQWVAHLGGKVQPGKHRHFSFCTYDEVIDVVCRTYELILR